MGWPSLPRGIMVSVFGQRDHLAVASESWTQPELADRESDRERHGESMGSHFQPSKWFSKVNLEHVED